MGGNDHRIQSLESQAQHQLDEGDSNGSSENEHEEIEGYNDMMEQLMQSTCAVYSKQVDRTQHLVFGSKVIQETSLYSRTIRRWYLTYKECQKRDKRSIARRVVRDLVESGCRFYQPPGDKKYSNILLAVQDAEKIETRVIRDLQVMIRSEQQADSSDAMEENEPEMQTFHRSSTMQSTDAVIYHQQDGPPVPHVDIPKISCHTSGGADGVQASEEVDDMSSIHDVSIEIGNVSRSSSSLGHLQGHGSVQDQKDQGDAADLNAGEQDLLDPTAPLQLNRLESWSRRQLEDNEGQAKQENPVLGGNTGVSGPEGSPHQEKSDVSKGRSNNEGEEVYSDSTGKATLKTGSKKSNKASSRSSEEEELQSKYQDNTLIIKSPPSLAPLKRASITYLSSPRRGSGVSQAGAGILPLLPRPSLAPAPGTFQDLPGNGHWIQVGTPATGVTPIGGSSLTSPTYPGPRRIGTGPRNISAGSINSSKKRASRPNEEQQLARALADLMPRQQSSPRGAPVPGSLLQPGSLLVGQPVAAIPPPRPAKRARRGSSSTTGSPSKLKSPTPKKAPSHARQGSSSSASESPGGDRKSAKKGSSVFGLAALAASKMDPNSDQFKKIVGEMMARLQGVEQRMQVMESQNRRLKQRLVDLEEEEDRRGQVTVHHASALAASYAMQGGDSGADEHPVPSGPEEHEETTSSLLGNDMMMWW